MEQFVRVRQEFEAAHQLVSIDPDRPRCGRVHGHRWSIEVEKRGAESGLEGDLYELAALELADHNLNEMFPRLNTSPEQLAMVLMERLLLAHPTIVSVEVSDGRVTGIARNTIR